MTFWEVVEHLPKKKEKLAISEINRVLKNDGLLFLSTPNKSFFSNLLDPAYFLKGHRHYSLKEISNLMKECNFHIKEHGIKGGFYSLISMNLFYINKHIFRRTTSYLQNKFEDLSKKDYRDNKKGFSNLFIVAQKKDDRVYIKCVSKGLYSDGIHLTAEAVQRTVSRN